MFYMNISTSTKSKIFLEIQIIKIPLKINGTYFTNLNKFKPIVLFMTHLLQFCLLIINVLTVNILNRSHTKLISSNLTSLRREENPKLSKNNSLTKVMKLPEKEEKVLCLTFYLKNNFP